VNEITILDLFLMHIQYRRNHHVNMDILKSMYETTHHYYITVFTAVLVLLGGMLTTIITLLARQQITNTLVVVILIAASLTLLIPLSILRNNINRLHKDYLDILKVYNLLSQYF
jgi:hypothetical protein